MRLRLALCLVTAIAGGCGGGAESPAEARRDAGAPSHVIGPVLKVTSGGLGRVESFEVRDNDRTYEILIDPDEDYDFPLDHLSEHRASGAPVRVGLDNRAEGHVATSISDA